MQRKSTTLKLFAGIGAIMAMLPPAGAQVTTATLYGTVQDSSGAVLPGAMVALANENTGTAASKVSDAAGEFVFDFIPVGSYTVRIEAKGFKTLQARGLELSAGQSLRRPFTLELGALNETVSVTAETPMVNTVSAEQRESFTTQKVVELPLSRRNVTNLLSVGTGVTLAGNGGVRLNGLGRSSLRITVDGTNATSNGEAPGTSLYEGFNFIDTMSIEAVQEVQVTKGVVPAEYAHQLGGNINLISRSGTNAWHGSLFENFQAENLNARNQFLATKPPLTFNQFGGSIGGPIKKDRIFIFVASENYQLRAASRVTGDVPTARLREEMIQAVPSYKLFLDTLPLPNLPHAPTADVGRFESVGSESARDKHVVAKGDLRVTDFSSLSLTYTRGRPFRMTPRVSPVNSRTWEGTTERGTANFITGAATWSAETRFGYNLNLIDRIDQFWNVGLAHGIAETTPGGRRTPSISALGFSDGGGSELASYFGPVWTLEQKVSKSLGRHQLKFGGIFSRRKPGRLNIENSRIRYENKADLLANIPSRVQMTFGVNRYQGRSFEWGGFAQDDWRVTPRLTVNLGIRYDFFSKFVAVPDDPSAPAGLFNLNGLRDSQFNFGPFRDPNDPIESDGWANLGPRIGFSYNPDGNSKTVIRSGFGILFAPQPWDDFNNAVASSQAVPFRSVFSKAEAQREGFRFPAFNDDIRPVLERSGQVQTADVFDPNIQAPYSINYLFGIQRAITSGLVLESSYVGSRGVKFRLSRPFNQPDRVTGIRPNPNLGTGNYFDNSESTTYHSWQTSLRKRFSHGFTGDVHYTWGKTLSFSGGDTGAGFTGDKNNSIQDFFDVDVNRGPSTGDIVHNFVGDLIYEVPRFQQLGFVRHVLGGWQVSGILRARTGEPFTVTQPSSMSASRPDYVGGNAILDDYRSSLVYLNRAAFQRVPTSAASGAPLRAGSVGNNAFRGPGFISLDGSVGKNFSITERTRLQFRADMFNAANHTNYSNPNGNIESPTFGRITGTRGARTVQLNARFTF